MAPAIPTTAPASTAQPRTMAMRPATGRAGRPDKGRGRRWSPAPRGTTLGCRSDHSRCLTHDLWEELGTQIQLYLSSVSLEDVCARRLLCRHRAFALLAPGVAAD